MDNLILEGDLPSGENIKSMPRVIKKRLANSKKGGKSTARNIHRKKTKDDSDFLSLEPANPIWLTMAETAKLGGVQKRTIKRALRSGFLKYRIIESRYQVDLRSALLFLFSRKKLWNKLNESGIGQYVGKWKN
ncbi:MAG: hypothetical protein PHO56_02575 [Patescibacteria group bacterium]|nr:hypothetical protein [Patescibacteria group bacterium]